MSRRELKKSLPNATQNASNAKIRIFEDIFSYSSFLNAFFLVGTSSFETSFCNDKYSTPLVRLSTKTESLSSSLLKKSSIF
jgi:hypothetical protein